VTRCDVAIVGGGPAGLAAAIRSARRGFHTVVLERSAGPVDKACGEGLMPAGQQELHDLGVRISGFEFHGIRYIQEDGAALEAPFRNGSGLGLRRTALSDALRQAAAQVGADLRHATVHALREPGLLETSAGEVRAGLVVAADGLHSPLRRAAGLERPVRAAPRFGLRQHFAVKPWTNFVEVHWAPGVEAYVTPVGPQCTNVAFLFSRKGDFDTLLGCFPLLRERLSDPVSEQRGAGPLLQTAARRTGPRLALLGDAAGYVDAITGQGLTLAFTASRLLFDKLDLDNLQPALDRYEAALRGPWRRYAVPAAALVWLSSHAHLRRAALGALGAIPGGFTSLVNAVG
jgi:flavin-dependent dehydrogenase